jgi:hypothetical protein
MWVVGGTGGATIATSPDGITWTARANPLNENVRGIGWHQGVWIAAGTGSGFAVATSEDGITWTGRSSPLGNGWDVRWGGLGATP